mgnify:CR=1 FL=1
MSSNQPTVFSEQSIRMNFEDQWSHWVAYKHNREFPINEKIIPMLTCPIILVLLAIRKNWNRSILGAVPSIYRNTIGNLTVQIWFRYQPSYQISGSIEGTTLKITKIYATYNDYSSLRINTGGISPWFDCHFNSRYIGPLGWFGKAIRGFSGYLSALGRQLPEIDIQIPTKTIFLTTSNSSIAGHFHSQQFCGTNIPEYLTYK